MFSKGIFRHGSAKDVAQVAAQGVAQGVLKSRRVRRVLHRVLRRVRRVVRRVDLEQVFDPEWGSLSGIKTDAIFFSNSKSLKMI